MTKRNKIIYWIATCWLALGMFSTGVVQLFKVEGESDYMTHLGYPSYFMSLLGIWKIAGVIAILIPRFPLLKEWAYAGYFFVTTGALYSHIAAGDPISKMLPSLLLLVLTTISWYFRPATRRPVLVQA